MCPISLHIELSLFTSIYLYRLRLVYCQYHPTASMLYTDRLTTTTVIRLSVDISRKTPMLHMRYHSQWVTLTFDLACR